MSERASNNCIWTSWRKQSWTRLWSHGATTLLYPGQRMLEEIKELAAVAQQAFSRKGFRPSLKPGKASIVVSLKGFGAPEMTGPNFRHEEFNRLDCQAPRGEQSGCTVTVMPHYKHLGTYLMEGLKMDVEIAARIGSARRGFKMIARPLLCKRRFPTHTRLQMYRLLIGPRLYFGAGAWPLLPEKLVNKLQAFELRCLPESLAFDLQKLRQ